MKSSCLSSCFSFLLRVSKPMSSVKSDPGATDESYSFVVMNGMLDSLSFALTETSTFSASMVLAQLVDAASGSADPSFRVCLRSGTAFAWTAEERVLAAFGCKQNAAMSMPVH